MKRHLIIILSCLLAACTHNSKDEGFIGLRITHSKINFPYKESSYPVTILSETHWTLTADQDWISASLTEADCDAAIFLTVRQNDSGMERSCTVTVTNEKGSRTISITQSPDQRNFTDIMLSVTPSPWQTLSGVKLIIPYRKGDGILLEEVGAGVAGKARGTVSVTSLQQVRLEEGEGAIELPVSGRTGAGGLLLFTVTGLPSSVFGEAAQCAINISEGAELEVVSIQDLRRMSDQQISRLACITGSVVSSTEENVWPANTFVIQDAGRAGSGITIRCDEPVSVGESNTYRVFLKENNLKTEGIRILQVHHAEDIESVESATPFDAVTVGPEAPKTYESMLCCIEQAQIKDTYLDHTTLAGAIEMEAYGWSETFWLTVPEAAAFAQRQPLSGSGTIIGIVGIDSEGNLTLTPRSYADVSGLTGNRLDLSATVSVNPAIIKDIPSAGADNLSFSISANTSWTVTTSTPWIQSLSKTSGSGDAQVSFSVPANSGARRRGLLTVSGQGVPDVQITVIQLEGNTILDNDFSRIISEAGTSPKIFPSSAGVDYAQNLSAIGLDGWELTNGYLSVSPDLQYGLLRVGKTLTKGSLLTPALTAIGSDPVPIEVSFLSGILNGCRCTWCGIVIEGPGQIQEGNDVIRISEYNETYTDEFVDTLPIFVANNLSTSALKRVTFRVEGATSETRIRLTATCKGGASASNCNLFFVGDFHVRYTD